MAIIRSGQEGKQLCLHLVAVHVFGLQCAYRIKPLPTSPLPLPFLPFPLPPSPPSAPLPRSPQSLLPFHNNSAFNPGTLRYVSIGWVQTYFRHSAARGKGSGGGGGRGRGSNAPLSTHPVPFTLVLMLYTYTFFFYIRSDPKLL